MRRILGLLLLVPLLLAGCGTDDTDPTDESATDEPTADVADSGAEVVEVLDASAAGGVAAETFTRVDDEPELAAFLTQLTDEEFAAQVRESVESAPAGTTYAAVAALGCDVPPVDVEKTTTAGEYAVVVGKVTDPLLECLAPVTTVAVMVVG